jgi:Domain of unknown function (DUF4124)
MNRIRLLVSGLAAAAALAAAGPVRADFYRWIDKNGHEHYSAHLEDVPPSQRAAAAELAGQGTLSEVSADQQRQRRRAADAVRDQPRPDAVRQSPAAIAPAEFGGHDEDWWRTKADKLREKVASAEQNLAKCEERDSRNRMASGLTPLDACAWQTSRVESAEDDLSEFEDRAREKGVPNDWIR